MSESFIDLKCNKSCRHIRELEQQLSELKESQKQKQITRLCNRLDKAEQQNKELIKFIEKIDDSFDYEECPVVKRQIAVFLNKYK